MFTESGSKGESNGSKTRRTLLQKLPQECYGNRINTQSLAAFLYNHMHIGLVEHRMDNYHHRENWRVSLYGMRQSCLNISKGNHENQYYRISNAAIVIQHLRSNNFRWHLELPTSRKRKHEHKPTLLINTRPLRRANAIRNIERINKH